MIDNRLITFLTVSDTGSITKAAEVLNLSQPAVTQQVKYLEEYYGVKLVKKIGRQIQLNEEGMVLCDYIRRMKAIEERMINHIHNQSRIVKRYKLGATRTIGSYIAPDLLGGYKKAFPNIEVVLEVANTQDTIRKLFNDEIDLAFVEGIFDQTKYKNELYEEDELVAAFSAHHPLVQAVPVELEEILKEPLITREKGSGTREIMEHHLLIKGYGSKDWNMFMEIGDITAIKSLIRWNLGYSIISKAAIQSELAEGSICAVLIKDFQITRGFYFVWREESPQTFIHSFINYCKERKKHNYSL